MADEPINNVKPEEAVNQGAFDLRLYDHDEGKWITANPNDAFQKVASGRYTLESGIRIPVVNLDGKPGTILSDNAYEEFTKNGIRPLTKQIQNLAEEVGKDKINQAIYGDRPADAFIQGALRATTLGLSDAAFKAIGVDEGVRQTKERNPISSVAGEIAGTAATIAGGASLAAPGFKAVSKGAAAALEGANPIAAKAAQFAAEGAYFGIGQGVSEASLGDPEDVVDHLVSGVGMGALVGGVTGAAFGVAEKMVKPVIDKLVDSATKGTSNIVNKIAREAAKKNMTAAMKAGGADEAAVAKMLDFANNPEFREFAAKVGPERVKELNMEAVRSVKDAQKLFKAEQKDIVEMLRGQVDEVQNLTVNAVKQAAGSIDDAVKLARDHAAVSSETFENLIASASKESSAVGKAAEFMGAETPIVAPKNVMADILDDAVGSLRKQENARSYFLASKLDALRNHALTIENAADEAALHFKVLKTVKAIGHDEKGVLKEIETLARDTLASHPNPNIQMGFKQWDSFEKVADDLTGLARKNIYRLGKNLEGDISFKDAKGVMNQLNDKKSLKNLLDPANREALAKFFDNIEQFGDDFKALNELSKVKDNFAKLNGQAAVLESVETKLRPLLGKEFNPEAVVNVLEDIGGHDFSAAIKNLKAMQETQIGMAEGSAIDRFIAAKKGAGGAVEKELEAFSQLQDYFNFHKELKGYITLSMDPNRAMLGGAIFKNPLAVMLSMKMGNASKTMKTLTDFERATKTGAKMTSDMMAKVTGALTGNKGQTVGKTLINFPNPSLSEKRKTYEQVRQAIHDSFQEPPRQNEAFPNIYKQLEQKRMKALEFLKGKLPLDPLETTNLGVKTGYVPSDFELNKFYQYVDAANNPLKVLDNISKNKVSPEEIETLQTLYPKMYSTLQNQVLDAIIEGRTKLNYQQKLTLSTAFGVPADYSMQPDFIKRMQEGIHKNEGGRPQGAGEARKIEIDLKPQETVATSVQQLVNK